MTGNQPAPTFATDILPKFRPQDIGCMRSMGVRLADPNWMTDPGGDTDYPDYANARRVFARLQQGDMPPDGAWSGEWLAAYQAWMAGGFNP
jgi:hypothetical protein